MTKTIQGIRIATWTTMFWTTMFSLTALFGDAVSAQQLPEGAADGKAGAATDSFAISEELQTPEQLFGFIGDVVGIEPDGQTEQEMIAHHRKIANTVIHVSDKVLSLKPSDQEATQGYSFKLQALWMLQELGDSEAEKVFSHVVDEARADSRPEVAAVGIQYFVDTGYRKWATLGEEDRSAMLDAIAQYVSQSGSGVEQLQLTLNVAGFLGDMENEKLAKQLLDKLMPGFQKSEDEQVQDNLWILEGIARRLNLPGQKMKLTGTLLDGSPLDWASYRGKVVLVDFWATWCEPCRDEVPNVLKMYHAYHDKGFEVLGISLDSTAEEAKSYIERAEIPWKTVFSENEAERGWKHPMAKRYGIDGIPRAILVDRDGTVVSMTARGKELSRLLRKILGEPLARTETIEGNLVKQVAGQSNRE